MTKHKLDIFELLGNVDNKNREFYSDLPVDKKKAFAGVVAMRWLSSAPEPFSDYYLIATNSISNKYFFEMHEHPELQYKLMTAVGCGQKVRHSWVANAKKNSVAGLFSFISQYYPRANTMELEMIISKYDKSSFSEFVDGTAIEKNEATKIKKAFGAYVSV